MNSDELQRTSAVNAVVTTGVTVSGTCATSLGLARQQQSMPTWLRPIAGTFRKHRIGMSVVLAIWVLALVRLLADPTPRLPLVFNWTPSLPYHVALARYHPQALHRGDYVLFRFDGPEQLRRPGLQAQPFFKQIAGVPGDRIEVHGRVVKVAGMDVGSAKTHSFDRQPLQAIEAGVIPPGHYYMRGSSPDSFDSRYRSSGLVRADQIIATLTPLF
jgi:conjugal transfer pilin signal peptidase TrbI